MSGKSFKLYFLNSPSLLDVEVIRRVQLPCIPSWNQFVALLQSYSPDARYSFNVKWVDEDGDEITLNSQEEWSEAISSMPVPPFKFYISKEKSDEPLQAKKEVQVQGELVSEYFYTTKQDSTSPEHKSLLQRVVPEIISQLMVNGAVPSWATVAVRSAPDVNEDVLLDVDISVLSIVLHRRAWSLLNESKDNDQEAARLLRFCVELTPNDHVAHYNLACTYSRLHRAEEALASLQTSIRICGKEDSETIKNDEDLQYLRETEEFKRMFPHLLPSPAIEEKLEAMPEPVVAEPIPSEFHDAIQRLHELGFHDDHVNVSLLREYNGDVSLMLQDQLQSCLFWIPFHFCIN